MVNSELDYKVLVVVTVFFFHGMKDEILIPEKKTKSMGQRISWWSLLRGGDHTQQFSHVIQICPTAKM